MNVKDIKLVDMCELVCAAIESLGSIAHSMISIPASVIKARVFYLSESEQSKTDSEIYKKLHYLVYDERSGWGTLTKTEKNGLLRNLSIDNVIYVYTH
jgi:hypothetical protein